MRQNIIFVLSIATVFMTSVNAAGFFEHDSDIGLINFMARSSDILRQDPTRSLNCFNYYIPKINEIAQRYEANFQACLNESVAARSKADESTLDQRNDLANAAEASCALLSQCNESDSVSSIFQCYIDGGSSNIQTMYAINANASQELAALREQYYLIEAQEYRCTNETKRVYEKESSVAYAQLNSCISGQSEVPTEPPPTTTTENIPSESTAPAETTPGEIDSTTVEIEPSTEGPEPTAEEPEPTAEEPEPTAEEPEPTAEESESTSEEPELN